MKICHKLSVKAMHRTKIVFFLCLMGMLFLSSDFYSDVDEAGSFPAEKFIEAEAGVINGPMQRYSSSEASGGYYLMNHYTTTRRLEDPSLQAKPDVSYSLSIPENGDYFIWLRVKVPVSGQMFGRYLSLYVGADNSKYNAGIVTVTQDWEWQRLTNLRLTKGLHTLDFKHKDFGFGIDKLFVTSTGSDLSALGMNPTREDILKANYNVPINLTYPALTENEGLGMDFPKPPAEHPRLYLRSSDIPLLKEKTKHPSMKLAWEKITESSRQQVDGLLDAPIDGRENFNLNIINAIEAKALMYVMYKDKEQGRNAIETMLNFFNTVKFKPSTNDITRLYGRFTLACSMVYDWCHDLLTEEEKNALIAWTETMASRMELGWPVIRQGAVVGHGSEMQLMRDMLSAGIAMYDEKKEIYNLAAGRFFRHFVAPRKFFYPAGYHHQGSSYGITRFNCEMWPTYIFDRMGYPDIFGKDQGKVPYYWIYLRRPDGQYFRNGDDFKEKAGFGQYWTNRTDAMAGYYFKDPVIVAEAEKQGAIGESSEYLFDFLFFPTDIKPNKDKSLLPLSRYFPAPYGAIYARTSWNEGMESDAVVAEMKIGVHNFGNHQHLDAGNFQIYYKGPLAVESGIYEGSIGGYGSAHDFNYHKRTIAHNAMLVYDPDEKFARNSVNDGGQRYPNNGREPSTYEALMSPEYKTGEVLAHQIGPDKKHPDYSYLKGNIAPAYSGKVGKYQRSFVFLNLGDKKHPAALFVFDHVVSSNKDFRKYWLLHSVEEPDIHGNIATIVRCGKGYNGKLVNTTILPSADNLDIIKVGGKGEEFTVFGKNFPQHYNNDKNSFDGAAWRIEVSPKTAAASDNFLNVMQVLDAEGGPDPLETMKIESDELIGARIADRAVLFNKKGDKLHGKIAFSIPGNGPCKVLLTDLVSGFWNVSGPGEKLARYKTDQESGTLYFAGKAGNYIVEPVN